MESITAKKKFCSPLHRLYWNREKEKGTLGLEIIIKDGKAELAKYDRDSGLPTEVKIGKPKTLDELKALCPHKKGTDEFREWVRTERQNYKI